MLKEHFGPIMNELEQESTFYRFDLVLPDGLSTNTKHGHGRGNNNNNNFNNNSNVEQLVDEKDNTLQVKQANTLNVNVSSVQHIPESRIAQRLRYSLVALKEKQKLRSQTQNDININKRDAWVDDGNDNSDASHNSNISNISNGSKISNTSDNTNISNLTVSDNTGTSANTSRNTSQNTSDGKNNNEIVIVDEKSSNSIANGYNYSFVGKSKNINNSNSKNSKNGKNSKNSKNMNSGLELGMINVPSGSNINNLSANLIKVDALYVKMCEKIIVCFESLYRKYIDSSNAIFEINISSKQRQDLIHLFDTQYYRRLINSSNYKSGSGSGSGGNNSVDSPKVAKLVIKSYKNDSVNMSVIKQELNDLVAGEKEMNEYRLVKFLLKKIIYNVEMSVCEVSTLMNNSFIRFLNQHRS